MLQASLQSNLELYFYKVPYSKFLIASQIMACLSKYDPPRVLTFQTSLDITITKRTSFSYLSQAPSPYLDWKFHKF